MVRRRQAQNHDKSKAKTKQDKDENLYYKFDFFARVQTLSELGFATVIR